jgi:hypothetical protein
VQQLLARVLGRDAARADGERLRVLAPAPHDVAGGLDAPQVRPRVVAERGEQAVGGRVAQGARVEVELGVRRLVAGAEAPLQRLQVADAHVVGDDGELLRAAEGVLGDRQVARRPRERCARVEALVDPAAQRAQPPHAGGLAAALGAGDLPRQARAALGVDAHAEQVLAGLGEDLRQAGGRLGVAGAGVGEAGALQVDHRLDRVGVVARLAGDLLDQRAVAVDALGRGDGAPGHHRVQRMGEAGGGAALELLDPAGVVGERVLDPGERVGRALARGPRGAVALGARGGLRAAHGRRSRVAPAVAEQHRRRPGRQHDHGDQRHEPCPSGLRHVLPAWQSRRPCPAWPSATT